jgi:hypothetical protein
VNSDLAILVIADEASQRERTLRALSGQTGADGAVIQTSWGALPEAVAALTSTWVAILPDGAEPSPDWLSVVEPVLSEPDVGCVGGRVLEFEGAAMGAGWYRDAPRAAWIDWLGRIHSRFGDIPDVPIVQSVGLVRTEGALVLLEDLAPDVLAGFERWTHHELAGCFRSRRRGRRTVFDSRLVVCRTSGIGRQTPPGDDPGAWEEFAFGEARALSRHPRRWFAAWSVIRLVLLGSRTSPGVLLWPLYARTPGKRARWRAAWRGKSRALRSRRS